ncbi:hypothetical protein GOP47_0022247 [Adiantum capillus-veneris]|uniref:Uncharacterized protein n=1 Tax=Adiantum capillus-veneris TaxID=13818 RepID=A0A9D4Z7D0_ADICA|nr:hypothetical protein GOP47_0022247 [Adiantum capillus-veneris]
MGNCGLGRHAGFKPVVKLVHSNGLIEEFHRPLQAGELLVDYPDHFICHVDGLSQLLLGGGSNGLLATLSESDEMDVGQIYFLLPKRMLNTAPSHADISALISKASMARKASYKGSQLAPLPLPARRGTYGHNDDDDDEEEEDEKERGRAMSRAFVQRVLAEAKLQMEKRTAADPSLGSGNPELQSAYTSHILAKSCARLWRPPLDTIYEEGVSVTAS